MVKQLDLLRGFCLYLHRSIKIKRVNTHIILIKTKGFARMSGPDKKKLDKMIWQLREGWGESTRVEAARDLGWIGTDVAEEAVPELIKALLDDKSENVRVEAAISLQWIGAKASQAAPSLCKALREDQSEKVRERAAIVLQSMSESTIDVVSILEKARVGDKSMQVRQAATTALEKLAEKYGCCDTTELIKMFKKKKK